MSSPHSAGHNDDDEHESKRRKWGGESSSTVDLQPKEQPWTWETRFEDVLNASTVTGDRFPRGSQGDNQSTLADWAATQGDKDVKERRLRRAFRNLLGSNSELPDDEKRDLSDDSIDVLDSAVEKLQERERERFASVLQEDTFQDEAKLKSWQGALDRTEKEMLCRKFFPSYLGWQSPLPLPIKQVLTNYAITRLDELISRKKGQAAVNPFLATAEKGDFNALRQEIITRRHSLEAHEKTYVEEAMQRCLSVKMRGLEESEVPDAVKEYYATFYQVARHFLKPPSNSPDLETLIHAVKHIEVSTIQDTRKQYMHEEAQRHLLGDFMKEESQGLLPLKRYRSDANIEPELFVLYDHLMIPDDMLHRTKDEDQVYKLLNTKEKRYPFSILGPPGVGKSGTAIRMVASRGGIIVEPSPGLDDQMRAVRGEESTSVIAYQQILFYGGLGHGFAYGVVLCDYLARILHFLITVRKSKKLERDIEISGGDCVRAQMNDRREEIASIMRELCVTLTLYRVPPSLLLPILNNAIETVRRETGLHYDTLIIDEAQVLNRSLMKIVSLSGKEQPLLAMYIARGLDLNISRLGCLSTTLSVDTAMRLFSGVAHDARWKHNEIPDPLVVTAWDAIRDVQSLRRYLDLHIDTSDCKQFFDFCKTHEKTYFPMRLRVAANIISNLPIVRREGAAGGDGDGGEGPVDKSAYLIKAMELSHSDAVGIIANAFSLASILVDKDPASDSLETTKTMADSADSRNRHGSITIPLIRLLYASLRGVKRKRLEGEVSADLVHLGVAGIEKMDISDLKNPKFWFRVDEPMTRMVTQRLLSDAANSSLSKGREWYGISFDSDPGAAFVVLQSIASGLQQGKSSVDMELSVFASLLHQNFQGKPIAELPFVHELESFTRRFTFSQSKDPVPLPKWAESVRFQCRAIASVPELLESLGQKSKEEIHADGAYFGILSDPSRRPDLLGIGCKLSKQNHSDLLLPLEGDDGKLYALVFSARIFRSLSREKHWTGFLSTDVRLMYLDNYVSIVMNILRDGGSLGKRKEFGPRLDNAISSAFSSQEQSKQQLNKNVQALFAGTGRILVHTGLPQQAYPVVDKGAPAREGAVRARRIEDKGTAGKKAMKYPSEDWSAMLAEEEFVRIVSTDTLDKFALTEKCQELIKKNMKKEHS